MARAARGTSRKKKNNVISVDFTGVENRGRFHEDGTYRLKVQAVTQETGQKDDYLSWVLESVDDENAGAIVYNNTSLSPNSLWNLKAFLEALGMEVPDDAMDIDLEEVVDLEFMGVVELEESGEYKGKPRLADFFPAEEEKKTTSRRRGKKDEDEEEEEKPARRRRGAAKEDEEDEKPSRSRRGRKEPEPEEDAPSEDEVNDMDQGELEDFIKENKLRVDLEDFSTLKKMRAGVIAAAKEKGIFEDEEEEEPEEEEEEKPARRRTRSRR